MSRYEKEINGLRIITYYLINYNLFPASQKNCLVGNFRKISLKIYKKKISLKWLISLTADFQNEN